MGAELPNVLLSPTRAGFSARTITIATRGRIPRLTHRRRPVDLGNLYIRGLGSTRVGTLRGMENNSVPIRLHRDALN